MAETDTAVEKPALKAPAGTVPDWYERIQKAKAARQLGIRLQAARKTEPPQEPPRLPTWQWHTDDA